MLFNQYKRCHILATLPLILSLGSVSLAYAVNEQKSENQLDSKQIHTQQHVLNEPQTTAENDTAAEQKHINKQKKNDKTDSVEASAETTSTFIDAKSQDPLEPFNRVMFAFNDKLDQFIFKPIAIVYNKILPAPIKQGIHNVYLNVGELPTIANDVLQFKFYQLANDTWRFGINSTLGIFGILDVATRLNLPHHVNDFGLTLAYYGYTESSYLVLPFFGAYTIRDSFSLPLDYYALSIYAYINSPQARREIYALDVIQARANLLQFEPVMDEIAIDKYVFVRSAYLQRRNYQIEHQGDVGYNDTNDEKPIAVASG